MTGNILSIAPASRKGMRLIISLYGLSETGKTHTALRLMAGMEPDPAKRGMLDTEGGQRGRAYVDSIPGGYLYADLTPPFTPERYMRAIDEFGATGVSVLTVDSISHAWFAEGGVLDMVELAPERNDMAKWAKPKRRLAKLTRKLLSSDMHIILCSRAKQPLVEEIVDGRKKLTPGPVVPIQEKTLRYDMTVIAHMLGDGRYTVAAADGGKCPVQLRQVFDGAAVMDETTGRRLVDWLGETDTKPADHRRLEAVAREMAERGSLAMRAWWQALPPAQQHALKSKLENFRSIAAAADDEAQQEPEVDPADPFGASDEPADDTPVNITQIREVGQ